jgi:dolichyl-phosphate beta-glucosyltransferase
VTPTEPTGPTRPTGPTGTGGTGGGADRDQRPTLTIVVPAYREAERLPASLPRLLHHLRDRTDVEVLVVDDGSTDDTVAVARSLLAGRPGARVLERPHRGKGAAVAAGMAVATGDRVVFMDADLATDLAALAPVVAALDHADVVLGSRRAPGAVTSGFTPVGALAHRTFSLLARVVTRVPVRDFQCGFKAFHAEAARSIFPLVTEPGYAFDVEVLVVAHRLGLRIEEVPVRWESVAGSHVRHLDDAVTMVRQLWGIARRHRTGAEQPGSRPGSRPVR